MSKAYTSFIGPNGTSKEEDNAVHQSSPTWVLTFIRWNVRDTLRAVPSTGGGEELLAVREPLVVENDCIAVSVNVTKGNLTPSVQMTLVESDVNYSTAIHPGDFVIVNMLNWESDARRIVNIARSNTIGSINNEKDGFKGIFKVQGVRKILAVDPSTGNKRVLYKINGFAFTEFNNSIYYNPYLRTESQGTGKDDLLFATNLQADYKQLINPDSNPHCQDIIRFLIESFIGSGISDKGQIYAAGSPITANTHFYIPQQVGTLLGVNKAKAAKDIYNYLFGIQQYAGSSKVSLATGMNPSNLVEPNGRFQYTSQKISGQSLLRADYWNQQKAWSILNQYVNAPLNEMYTCFRVDRTGKIMPTVVLRQIPFTSDDFSTISAFNSQSDASVPVTYFSNIPRWKISSAMIFSSDIGLEEAARVNFVQFYASPPADVKKADAYMSVQTAAGNYVYDINDVVRSGLRPYIITTSFQDLTIDKQKFLSKQWAHILADCVIGGQLKLNGTLECVGLVQPISVGDNLEFDGTIFHIEEVNHSCYIDNLGFKYFRTVLKLSNGVSAQANGIAPVYSEMTHTRGYQDRKSNYNNGNKNLPGVSEEQDTTYRQNPWPTTKDVNKKDAPFAQPGQIIKAPIKEEDDE